MFKLTSFAFIALMLILLAFSGVSNAQWRINWGVGAYLEHSDNIRRSDDDNDDAITLSPRASIFAVHEGPRLDAEIGAANEYRSNLSGDQGSNNNFDIDANVTWKIVPGLLEWSFEDHFNSEFPIDIRSEPNESNKQDINSVSYTHLTLPTTPYV